MTLPLRMEGVSRCLGGRQVLDGVDLEVGPGEVVGVLGANGAGKSTLLAVAAGLRRAAGRVWVAGYPVADVAGRARLGWSGSLGSVDRTVEGLLRVVVSTRGAGSAAAVTEVLGLPSGPVDALSAGQRRLVSLACALVHQPDLLLLDEPLTHLDADGMRRVVAAVEAARDRGAGVLVATHRPDELPLLRAQTLIDGKLR